MNLPPIVDAHHQFAPPDAGSEGLAPLLEQSGVERTVLVQPEKSLDATRAALELADASAFVAGAVVWADVTEAGLGGVLDQLSANARFRGICLPVSTEEDNHWLVQGPVLAGLREVAARGLSVDIIVEPRQLPSVRTLAEAIPSLRIAIAHIGSPFIGRSEREPWGVYMLNLAPLQNITVKLSGLVTLDMRPVWNTAHLKLFVEPMVRLFGYRRMMFGSDWPHHLSAATYDQVLHATIEAAGPMTDEQAAQVLNGTATEFYRLS